MPSKREIEILHLLSDGKWWRESNIKSSQHFLREMYFAGWLDGAGYDDDRGTGNYPSTRCWRITDRGRLVLKEKGPSVFPPKKPIPDGPTFRAGSAELIGEK